MAPPAPLADKVSPFGYKALSVLMGVLATVELWFLCPFLSNKTKPSAVGLEYKWCDFLKLFSYLSNQNSVSLCSGVGGEQCMLGRSCLCRQPAAWPTMLKWRVSVSISVSRPLL